MDRGWGRVACTCGDERTGPARLTVVLQGMSSILASLGAILLLGVNVASCTAIVSDAPAVRGGALSISVRAVHAPGWNATPAGSGLRVTEGWGYMDPNVLHVRQSAAGGGVTFGTIFFPCNAAQPSSKWLLYCAKIWRSSDGAQSPVLALGRPASELEAYQPPMLFFHNDTLLVANWAQTSAGSEVLLSSLSADGEWGGSGGGTWQLQARYSVTAGASFNYLGGAMNSRTGGIAVAGMLELDGPRKSTLGVLHASIKQDGSGWEWGTMMHAGPVYGSVDFQPLYPQVAFAGDGSLHILTTINSDAPCPSSSRPGHVNMGAMYRQLRYYIGTFNASAGPHVWTFAEVWRDLAPDAAEHPDVNGDPCLLYSERFPHDILADEDGGVLALYRADNQTDANNTLGLYITAWPLLYVAGGVTESRSANLAARAFSKVRSEAIQAMQITRVGTIGVVAAAVNQVCNVSICTSKLLLTTCSADFRQCFNASNPVEIAMPYGLGGNSIKLTQPLKNGGEDINGELALWWQGAMQPASTMNFLRYNLAKVRLQ